MPSLTRLFTHSHTVYECFDAAMEGEFQQRTKTTIFVVSPFTEKSVLSLLVEGKLRTEKQCLQQALNSVYTWTTSMVYEMNGHINKGTLEKAFGTRALRSLCNLCLGIITRNVLYNLKLIDLMWCYLKQN